MLQFTSVNGVVLINVDNITYIKVLEDSVRIYFDNDNTINLTFEDNPTLKTMDGLKKAFTK